MPMPSVSMPQPVPWVSAITPSTFGNAASACGLVLREKLVGNRARGRGRAVHAREHADVVARGHAAVGALDAHEGGFALRRRRLHVGAEGVVAFEVALVRPHVEVLRVHVLAGGDGLARETDDLVVAAHRLALRDGAHRNLVARGNEAAHGNVLDDGAAEQLGARDDDVVGGVESDVRVHGGDLCWRFFQEAFARRQLALNLWWNLSMCWCMASRAATGSRAATASRMASCSLMAACHESMVSK